MAHRTGSARVRSARTPRRMSITMNETAASRPTTPNSIIQVPRDEDTRREYAGAEVSKSARLSQAYVG